MEVTFGTQISRQQRRLILLTQLPRPSLLPGAGFDHTLLEVLKCFDSCYGMSYFQLVQEADMLKSQKKASLFVLYFWLWLEVECQKSIVSHPWHREFFYSSSHGHTHFAKSIVQISSHPSLEKSKIVTSDKYLVQMDLKGLSRSLGVVSDVPDN